jgi:hypothetical protein
VKFIIGDKEVEAKKLEVLHLTSAISEHLKEELMKDAVKMASYLEGKDKAMFLSDAYRTLPGGKELLEKAQEYLETPDGYKWIVKQATGLDDISAEDMESYVPVIEYALGVESTSPEEAEEAGGEPETAPLGVVESPPED